MVLAVNHQHRRLVAVVQHRLGRNGQHVVLDCCGNKLASAAPRRAGECVESTFRSRQLEVALERFGRVDAWVNNAGRGITRTVEELTDDDLDIMFRDNVKSALYGMQTVLPHFKQRRRGHLVNVSSMLARIPYASFRSAYSASKHALNSLTENLRMDLAKDFPDVRVTCVMPGVVMTDFGLNALGGGIDSRSLPGGQTAEQGAAIVADAIERGRGGDVYTGLGALERVVQYLSDLAAERSS